MLRSLFSGLSGVIASQSQLDVIGNNLANANTMGFKMGRMTFQDTFYQTLRPASGGGRTGFGADPVQIGSGVAMGWSSALHSQGALASTGQPLDMAIDGRGFFVVTDGTSNYYTRAGAFSLDADNNLVTVGSHMAVIGWQATDGAVDTSTPPGTLRIPLDTPYPARATRNVALAGNLNAEADVYAPGPPASGGYRLMTATVYDSQGARHLVEIEFAKTANNAWDWTATCESATVGTGTITFDAAGLPIAPGIPPQISITLTNGAQTPLDVNLDFDGLTQFAGDYTANVASQDGVPSGTIATIAVDSDGVITGKLTNGLDVTLGQLALAIFPNEGGLARAGNSLFGVTPNSGLPQLDVPGAGSRGSIVSRALEQSNVDLTQQFVDMIVTQRAFQASARVIAAANRMLDEAISVAQR
ncbi:MAG: flagellar hook protein FlgE [Armatimonadota bacterium]